MSVKIDDALLLVQFEKRREVNLGDLGESWDILGDLGDALGDDSVFGENGASFGEHIGEELVEDDLEKLLGDMRGDARGDLFPSPIFPALGDSGGVSSHSPLSWESGKWGKVVNAIGLDGEEGLFRHNSPIRRKVYTQ